MQGAVGDHPKLADLGTVIADTWPSRQVKVVGDDLYFLLPQYARCTEWERAVSLLIRGTVVTDTWPSCQVKVVGGAACKCSSQNAKC